MYQSNPRAPIPRSYPAHLKLFDSRLEALDLKLFDSFNSRKFDAKLRPPGRAFDYGRNVRQQSQDYLKLKDFVPIQYESATNKIFDSTSVFATESFCLSFIETETFKCGFVVRREFSFNVLSISVTRNLSQMTYFSKERFHWQATRVIRSKSTGHRRFRPFVVVYPFVFKIRQGGEFDAL